MDSDCEDEHNETGSILTAEYEDEYVSRTDGHYIISNTLGAPSKGKYYKQTYRTAWEHMPDFKGWLKGVVGEPCRAYCIYCQKTLHAHRLSLLKHTCTIRHQKAAQLHNTRKGKNSMDPVETVEYVLPSGQEEVGLAIAENMVQVQYSQGKAEMQDSHEEEEHVQEHEHEPEHEEVEEEEDSAEIPIQFQKFRQMAGVRPPISTHVLDTSKGSPVVGLQVSLYKLIDGRWTYINEGSTSPEGRFANFLEQNDFTPGRYKLHFDVDRYFDTKKQESLYPFIEIVFDCRGAGEHYHIPLLLSPFGYTTYRGS